MKLAATLMLLAAALLTVVAYLLRRESWDEPLYTVDETDEDLAQQAGA